LSDFAYKTILLEKAQSDCGFLDTRGIKGNIVNGSLREFSIKIEVNTGKKNHIAESIPAEMEQGKQQNLRITLYYSPKKKSFTYIADKKIETALFIVDLLNSRNRELPGKAEVKRQNDYFINIYVDGSYINRSIGYGGIILIGSEPVYEFSGKLTDEKLLSMRQVAGEIYAVIHALEWLESNYGNRKLRIKFFYDYEGLEKWANGDWKTNNLLTFKYKDIMFNLPHEIQWIKIKSHSNDFYNDKADSLAKKGALS